MAVATPKKTTFMVMSDTHNFEMGSADPSCPLRQPHAKVDVLLHCGDLTQVGGLSAYKKALRLLGHFEAELKLVIAGNHDISLDGDYWQTHLDEDNDPDEHQQAVDIMTGPLAKAAGVTYLTEGTHNITLKSGVTFSIYVSPYQPVCGDWAFGYERTKDRYSVKPAKGTMSISQHPIPRDVDIVMTHGPPHGVLDLIPSKNEHARCEALGNAMQRVRPLMHCFGHIHEGYGAQLRQWSDDEADGSAATARQAKIWALGETESHHQITPDAETLMINAAIMDDGGTLKTYIAFLASLIGLIKHGKHQSRTRAPPIPTNMANEPNADDPASPLHYPAAHTALLLLDFQNFIISMCGSSGEAAAAKATLLRQWALETGVMILHSIVDVNGQPAPACKGRERLTTMVSTLKQSDTEATKEPSSLAFGQEPNEYTVLKTPGIVSGIHSREAMELLAEHNIKSLLICGLSTSGCVLRTAVPATDDGFVVTIISDACADPKTELHEMLLEQVLPSRGYVASAEELMGWQL